MTSFLKKLIKLVINFVTDSDTEKIKNKKMLISPFTPSIHSLLFPLSFCNFHGNLTMTHPKNLKKSLRRIYI